MHLKIRRKKKLNKNQDASNRYYIAIANELDDFKFNFCEKKVEVKLLPLVGTN